MKTKDRVKEEIGLYKLLMTFTLAICSSLIGWLFQNAVNVTLVTIIVALAGIIISLLVTVFFFTNIDTRIKELDYDY